MARKIFVSYERHDRPTVDGLANDLRESGHEPYFDSVIAGGQQWWEELLRQIEGCDVFMPVLTQRYVASEACRLEREYTIGLNKPLLPIGLEHLSPGLFPPAIAQAQWVLYNNSDRAPVLDLMRGLNSLAPCPPLPDPMPPRPAVPISYLDDLQRKVDSPGELSRQEQLDVLYTLKPRLDGDDTQAAAFLLQRLRHRPDVNYQVATEIDEVLAAQRAGGTQSSPPPPPPPNNGAQTGPGTTTSPPPPGSGTQAGPQATASPPPPNQTPGGAPAGSATKPKTYLLWTIVTTLLLCLPIGAVGIYYSVQVDRRFYAGNPTGAGEASRRAKKWAIAAAIVGVILWIILIAAAAASPNSNSNSLGA